MTDTAQALAVAMNPNTPPAIAICIRSLVANIEERDRRISEQTSASAPSGYKCVDCKEDPCPACYAHWWQKRNPHVHMVNVGDTELNALRERCERLEEALKGLLDHFMWRYCRGKKEGREYDLPRPVLEAEAALAQGEGK